jgi:hypothetical protein
MRQARGEKREARGKDAKGERQGVMKVRDEMQGDLARAKAVMDLDSLAAAHAVMHMNHTSARAASPPPTTRR